MKKCRLLTFLNLYSTCGVYFETIQMAHHANISVSIDGLQIVPLLRTRIIPSSQTLRADAGVQPLSVAIAKSVVRSPDVCHPIVHPRNGRSTSSSVRIYFSSTNRRSGIAALFMSVSVMAPTSSGNYPPCGILWAFETTNVVSSAKKSTATGTTRPMGHFQTATAAVVTKIVVASISPATAIP